MSERTDRYDLSPPTEIVKGNFTLHAPTSPNLVPQEFPTHLSTREYEHVGKELPNLKRASLEILRSEEDDVLRFVGTIDFIAPSSCRRGESRVAGTIEKRLCLKLRGIHDASGNKVVCAMREGISIIDPLRPAVWAGITETDGLHCQLTLTADYNPQSSPAEQMADIHAVAEQWVELQEMIVQLDQLPYESPVQYDIYLDLDTCPKVSDTELTLMSIMASYGLNANLPRWDDDIDSRWLAAMEQYATKESLEDTAQELIAAIRERASTKGEMKKLSQKTIVDLIGDAIKRCGEQPSRRA